MTWFGCDEAVTVCLVYGNKDNDYEKALIIIKNLLTTTNSLWCDIKILFNVELFQTE